MIVNCTDLFCLKVYLIVDAESEFVLGILPYAGARRATGSETDHGPNVVFTLAKPFFNKAHVIVCDSFFPSLKLAFDLLDKGTFLVATIKSSRTGLPNIAAAVARGRVVHGTRGRGRRRGRGSRGRRGALLSSLGPLPTDIPLAPSATDDSPLVRQPLTNLKDTYSNRVWQHDACPQLTITRWTDRKEVLLISTATNPVYTSQVRRLQTVPKLRFKLEGVTVLERNSTRAKLPVRSPTAVSVYQKYMGSVDRVDQRLSYARLSRARTPKHWKVLFLGLVDLFIHNTFTLYHKHVNKVLSSKDFRLKLADELIGSFASGHARSTATQRQKDEGHLPDRKGDANDRRLCHHCKKLKTPFYCVACDEFFCIDSSRECFKKFHAKLFRS